MVQKLGKNVTNHLSVNQLFQFTVQSIFCMILETKISQSGIKHIEFQIAQRGEWFDPLCQWISIPNEPFSSSQLTQCQVQPKHPKNEFILQRKVSSEEKNSSTAPANMKIWSEYPSNADKKTTLREITPVGPKTQPANMVLDGLSFTWCHFTREFIITF